MRNRAKCKLCQDIIESFYADDYVPCKCGEIYVDGGSAMRCGANLWLNFLRLDDNGNEIVPKIQEKDEAILLNVNHNDKPSKKELLDILDEMRKNIENLPINAMMSPITHADFCSLLILLSSVFRAED
jgi:hypothetical protein